MISPEFGWSMLKKWQSENTLLSVTVTGRSAIFKCSGHVSSLADAPWPSVTITSASSELMLNLSGVEFVGYEDSRVLPDGVRDSHLDSFLGLKLRTEEVGIAAFNV